eukprot:TRINITY_DN1046_c1_g1_i1.p1 TRINITY_DN1046_c1_g1~~TRINITY_DN1046_c1_g1_i1.p1  ORF type:complete len:1178 (+),score=298.97 TRINITY_DN1046_c1_g1_i1:235-3768(+)
MAADVPSERKASASMRSSTNMRTVLLALSVALNVYFFAVAPAPSATTAPALPFASSGAEGLLAVSASAADVRRLATTAGSNASSASDGSSAATNSGSGSSAGDHHGPHQHDGLLFMFNALVVGCAIMHLTSCFPMVQTTVLLFVLGMVFSLFFEGLGLKNSTGVFGESYSMWMNIDPHMLLFALLPALLAGDAMTIDTFVAQRVALQCIYLAGPGVLIGTFSAATFLHFYLGWSFLLSTVAGSILCATDPVAVVSLLKELGASPTLTVQIQGESLLNDGTAIVVFMIAYNTLAGEVYSWDGILMFLVRKALMAWALGMFVGHFFFIWLRAASNRLSHSSSIIQITLTICCAYWSFIISEGVLEMSGVLSTVAASLVLADNMWPHIVCNQTMHHVWHMIESLGNILIFFLGGALTGEVMVHIPVINYLHLIVIYIVLLVVRGCLIFGSRPILRRLSPDRQKVSYADAAVMTWGGLRGAVGLALAIQVRNGRAPHVITGALQVSEMEAQQVLFFVAGIALLTTVINAVTAPMLVGKLGITAQPAEQLQLLRMLNMQLVEWSTSQDNPPEVTQGLSHMLLEIDHHIAKCGKKKDHHHDEASPRSPHSKGWIRTVSPMDDAEIALQTEEDNDTIIFSLRAGESGFEQLKNTNGLGVLDHFQTKGEKYKGIPQENLLGKVEDMVNLLEETGPDPMMAKVVNQSFLSLVERYYWKQIEAGDLRAGSEEAKCLLTSIPVSLSPLRPNLDDFKYIETTLAGLASDAKDLFDIFDLDEHEGHHKTRIAKALTNLITSRFFRIGIVVAIILSSLYVAIEESVRKEDDDNVNWLLAESFFGVIFLFEAVAKLIVMKCKYFKDKHNCFDFFLVVTGTVGILVSALESAAVMSEKDLGEFAEVVRVSRVLRVMRFLRIFRLFHAKLGRDSEVSPELATHLVKISTWMNFIGAHCHAQVKLIKYFGGNGKVDEPYERELARCILQSQIEVYHAITHVMKGEELLNDAILLQNIKCVNQRKQITMVLVDFVMSAYRDGAITAKETHSIVHPLHHQIDQCLEAIRAADSGKTKAFKRISTTDLSVHSERSGGHGQEEGEAKTTCVTTKLTAEINRSSSRRGIKVEMTSERSEVRSEEGSNSSKKKAAEADQASGGAEAPVAREAQEITTEPPSCTAAPPQTGDAMLSRGRASL